MDVVSCLELDAAAGQGGGGDRHRERAQRKQSSRPFAEHAVARAKVAQCAETGSAGETPGQRSTQPYGECRRRHGARVERAAGLVPPQPARCDIERDVGRPPRVEHLARRDQERWGDRRPQVDRSADRIVDER